MLISHKYKFITIDIPKTQAKNIGSIFIMTDDYKAIIEAK